MTGSRGGHAGAFAPLIVVQALLLAALACSLAFGQEDPAITGSGDDDAGSRTTPVIRILEPANGQQVPPDQPVDIHVASDSMATSFLINVNGRVASSKALPAGQAGPTEAILAWTPDQTGTYNLEIVAFNGSNASAPVTLTLDVNAAAVNAGAGPTGAGCTGRVLVTQLNYRDGPSTNATRLGKFSVGEIVTVVGRNANATWYQVLRADAQRVWVINNQQWMQIEGTCQDLPATG